MRRRSRAERRRREKEEEERHESCLSSAQCDSMFGSSRLSDICCNFLISCLGAQHVAAQEDGIKVAVESPKGLLFIYLLGPRETQPSVLYFIICVAPAPQT